jgi:hypothetical protein
MPIKNKPVSTPEITIALKLLERAKLDAARGNLEALAWLVTQGADIAHALSPREGREQVLAFARRQLARIETEDLKTTWGL